MNEQAILHVPNSKYCFAKDNNTVALRLRVAKNEKFKNVFVVYGGKYEYAMKQHLENMNITYSDRLYDYYTINLKLDDVRLVYVFKIVLNDGSEVFFCEDGIVETFDFKLAYYNAFQLPYINDIDVHRDIEWTKNSVVYQIFVDRFNIGKSDKDKSYINLKWGEIPTPKSYAGGDIRGIIEKLDYIKSLNVNTIYLTPIFQAKSNHKYNISDYFKVDSEFGTNEDFKELVDKAHEMGIKIILDAVFNHCSDDLPQFQDVVENGVKSKYYKWFMINGDKVNKKKCNYETFGACAYMPKLDTSNLEVQDFLTKIAVYWLKEYHIDGWRLDVSDEVSHDYWKKFRKDIRAVSPDCAIIGENWHDANPFLLGDEYDSIMNYAFTKACLDLFAFKKHTAQSFSDKLNEILMRNTDTVNNMMLNLIDSHDTFRFYTEVKKDKHALNCALALLFFFPGMPCVYYGTENNMEGNYDPDCRRTFDWDLSNKDNSTKTAIRELAKIKISGKLNDDYSNIKSSDGNVKIIRKVNDKENLVLFMNIENDMFKTDIIKENIVSSYNFENNVISKLGYIVYKEEK